MDATVPSVLLLVEPLDVLYSPTPNRSIAPLFLEFDPIQKVTKYLPRSLGPLPLWGLRVIVSDRPRRREDSHKYPMVLVRVCRSNDYLCPFESAEATATVDTAQGHWPVVINDVFRTTKRINQLPVEVSAQWNTLRFVCTDEGDIPINYFLIKPLPSL